MDLGINGLQVTMVSFDGAVKLLTINGLELSISGIFAYGELEVDPGHYKPEDGSLLRLWMAEIASATVDKRGDLRVSFENGASIHVTVSAEYEAWQLSGPNGLLLVSLPGGKVSDFTPGL